MMTPPSVSTIWSCWTSMEVKINRSCLLASPAAPKIASHPASRESLCRFQSQHRQSCFLRSASCRLPTASCLLSVCSSPLSPYPFAQDFRNPQLEIQQSADGPHAGHRNLVQPEASEVVN